MNFTFLFVLYFETELEQEYNAVSCKKTSIKILIVMETVRHIKMSSEDSKDTYLAHLIEFSIDIKYIIII